MSTESPALTRSPIWCRIPVVALLVFILALAWMGPLDRMGQDYVDQGLKRATVTFATARTANAVISVLKSTTISVSAIAGASASPGQLLDPLDELIEQFSTLMLAACISLAAQKLLISIGGLFLVNAGVTAVLLAWATWLFLRGDCPRWMTTLVVMLMFVRFAVPIAALASEAAFNAVMAGEYNSAESKVSSTSQSLSVAADEVAQSPSRIARAGTLLHELKVKIEDAVHHVVSLMAIFILQTLVLPLLFLWVVYRLFGAAFNWRHLPGLPRTPARS